jgi:hypothetical protein
MNKLIIYTVTVFLLFSLALSICEAQQSVKIKPSRKNLNNRDSLYKYYPEYMDSVRKSYEWEGKFMRLNDTIMPKIFGSFMDKVIYSPFNMDSTYYKHYIDKFRPFVAKTISKEIEECASAKPLFCNTNSTFLSHINEYKQVFIPVYKRTFNMINYKPGSENICNYLSLDTLFCAVAFVLNDSIYGAMALCDNCANQASNRFFGEKYPEILYLRNAFKQSNLFFVLNTLQIPSIQAIVYDEFCIIRNGKCWLIKDRFKPTLEPIEVMFEQNSIKQYLKGEYQFMVHLNLIKPIPGIEPPK